MARDADGDDSESTSDAGEPDAGEPDAGRRRGRRRTVLLVGGALVAAVVVGGILWVVGRLDDDTHTVTVDEAVASFQAAASTTGSTGATGSTSATGPGTTGAPSAAATSTTTAGDGLPTPGVYPYTTSGGEEVSILNHPTRTYAAETVLTVEPQGCGVVVRWTPLAERAESWELCRRGGGLGVSRSESVHSFFDQEERRSFTCDATTWLIPPGATVGATWTGTCDAGGLVEVRAGEVVELAPRTVGRTTVDAAHVVIHVVTSGSTTGTTTRDLWLVRATGLPIEWHDVVDNETPSPLGAAEYHEEFRLVATGLAPVS